MWGRIEEIVCSRRSRHRGASVTNLAALPLRMEPLEHRLVLTNFNVAGEALWTNTAGQTHAIPLARVEVLDVRSSQSEVIATAQTDLAGQYTLELDLDEEGAEDPLLFEVRLVASSPLARVVGQSGSGYYSLGSDTQEAADGEAYTVNFTAGNQSLDEQAFSVHTALVMAGRYASNLTGKTPSPILVRFGEAITTSSFEANIPRIQIRGTAAYEWDVILHEYGHYIQAAHGLQNTPAGEYSFVDDLAELNGDLQVGQQLAWSEAWPTYFSLSAQWFMAGDALGIEGVGDTRYDSFAGAVSYDAETASGTGEASILSVLGTLWDLVDAQRDGLDSLQLGDQFVFDTLRAANATTIGEAWTALAAKFDTADKTKLAGVFAQNGIAPRLTGPEDFSAITAHPPTYNWTPGGGGAAHPLDEFRVRVYSSDYSELIFEKHLGDTTSYTPSIAEWNTIRAGSPILRWVIEGRHSTAPGSADPAANWYWSNVRTQGGADLVLVVGKSSSMQRYIPALKTALQRLADEVVPAGEDGPLIQLVTFRNKPTVSVVSRDPQQIIAALDDSELSGPAHYTTTLNTPVLELALDYVAAGGDVLLLTDMATIPDVAIHELISKYRAKDVRLSSSHLYDPYYSGPGGGLVLGSYTTDSLIVHIPELERLELTLSDDETTSALNEPSDTLTESAALPRGTFFDPGQAILLDDHGNTTGTATPLKLNGAVISGTARAGESADADYFYIKVDPGQPFEIVVQAHGGSRLLVEQVAGIGIVVESKHVYGSGSTNTYKYASHSESSTREFYIRITASDADARYSISLSSNELTSAGRALDLLPSVTAQTGGSFNYLFEFANADKYFNALSAPFQPSVISARSTWLAPGSTTLVQLQGQNTNWRPGYTDVVLDTPGLSVLDVSVESPTLLTVRIVVAEDFEPDQHDVKVVTRLDSRTTEVAVGHSVFNRYGDGFFGTITNIDPFRLTPGTHATIKLHGIGTNWTSAPYVTLFEDQTVRLVGPDLVEIDVFVPENAQLGHYDAIVDSLRTADPNSPTNSDYHSLVGVVGHFSYSGTRVLDVVPLGVEELSGGQLFDLLVTGADTNFMAGVTKAVFAEGIEVHDVTVLSPTEALVRVYVLPGADSGFRNVRMITGEESALLQEAVYVANEADDDLRFIGSVYIATLGRELDVVGQTAWYAELQSGATREELVSKILNSIEYHEKQIADAYVNYLGRSVDDYGAMTWLNRVLTDQWSHDQIREEILNSAEYFAFAGENDEAFITSLYQDLLARDVDPAGLAAWLEVAVHEGRAAVTAGLLSSDELHQLTLDHYYTTLLGRPADPSGEEFWMAALSDGTEREAVLLQILASDEFYDLHA